MSIVRVQGVTKIYPGTVALNNVNVEFRSGKVNALVGKNGSGKSTLLKIIAGAVERTEGHIYLDDKPVVPKSPEEAYSMGIATVFQELSIVPGITVAENILIGRLPRRKSGLVDWKQTYQKAQALLDELGIEISAKTMAYTLTASQLQMVEIAKAMSYEPKVLQLDEPTSSLSQKEVETLFRVMRRLKEKDVLIIFVSHRLQELWDVCDTCTVFRDGLLIASQDMQTTSREELLRLMFGEVEIPQRDSDVKSGEEVVMKVDSLCRNGKFRNISFELHKGEILGIAGMLGSGRTELLRSIFGADGYTSGAIYVNGEQIKKPTPEKMKMHGVAMLQEDRKRDGIIANDSISSNMMLSGIDRLGKGIFVHKSEERKRVKGLIDRYEIKLSSAEDPMSSLSGGNQQKVIVARWMNIEPKILMFDEPSRGIDVASKQQIFKSMWEMSRQGIASIMVSSELEELLTVCTRILILKNGALVSEIDEHEIREMSAEQLYLKCM